MIDEAPTRALRERDADVLRVGLHCLLVDGEEEWLKDWRDLLVVLAPYHDCARRLELDPAVVFAEAAENGPATLTEIVREFGYRRDVTPRAFGFEVIDGPGGPRYEFVDRELPSELLDWLAAES